MSSSPFLDPGASLPIWQTDPLLFAGAAVGGVLLADAAIVPISAGLAGLVTGHGWASSHMGTADALQHALAEGITATWGISPAAFWTSHAFCTAVMLGMIAFGYRTWRKIFHRSRQDIEEQLRSHSQLWATAKDVESISVPDAATTTSMVLGRLANPADARNHPVIAAKREFSTVVVAPTRSGKTTSIVVPALLRWAGPIVTTSTKRDVFDITRTCRVSRGPVRVFDPENITGAANAKWSPLLGCATWKGAFETAQWLADASGESTSHHDPFWAEQAKILVAPLLLWAANTRRPIDGDVCEDMGVECTHVAAERTMLDVYDAVQLFARNAREIIGELTDLGFERAANSLEAVRIMPDQTRGGVLAQALATFRPYASPSAEHLTCVELTDPDLLDWDELLDKNGALYLVAGEQTQKLMRPVFEAMLTSLMRRISERYLQTGQPLPNRLLMMLDEAAHTASPRDLGVWLNAYAGQGVTIASIWQNIAQVEEAYGPSAWRNIWAGHPVKMLLGGITDTTTLEWGSTMFGTEAITSHSVSSDGKGGYSIQQGGRDLTIAPAEWIRQRPVGTALAVVGDLKPLQLSVTPWYQDEQLTRLVPAAVQTAQAESAKR